MRTKLLLSFALLICLASVAWVRRGRSGAGDEPLTGEHLAALLARPLEPGPKGETRTRSLWEGLLALPAAVHADGAVTLRLGRVLADPSSARLAAERAGELLALPAEGPDGALGVTLLQAVLDGPATQDGPDGRVLALHGCRHTADADAGPLLEDTYVARLSLARALRAGAAAGEKPLTLRGEETPAKSGVNFEVQLRGEEQLVVVTFDGSHTSLSAHRRFRPSAPNDARARAALASALESQAAAQGVALRIEGREQRVPHGVDVRIEIYGTRLALTATNAGQRLSAYLELGP